MFTKNGSYINRKSIEARQKAENKAGAKALVALFFFAAVLSAAVALCQFA